MIQPQIYYNKIIHWTKSSGWNNWILVIQWFAVSRLLFIFAGLVGRFYIQPLKQDFPWIYSKYEVLNIWGMWDTGWYLSLAKYGYDSAPSQLPNTLGQSNLAFFPLYPLLVKWLSWIGSDLLAAIIIANLACLLAGLGLYKLTAQLYDANTAKVTLKIMYLYPLSFLFSAALTESLFSCLVIWSFYWMYEKKFWLSSLSAYLAGLTRIVGIILLPAQGIWRWQQKYDLKSYLYILAPVAGLLTFTVYLYWQNFDPLGFITAQRAWGRHFEWPGNVLLNALVWGGIADKFNALIAGCCFTLLWLSRKKLPKELLIFSFGVLILPLFTGIASFARYSLSAFPLFISLALLLKNPKLLETWIIISIGLGTIFMLLWTSGFTLII